MTELTRYLWWWLRNTPNRSVVYTALMGPGSALGLVGAARASEWWGVLAGTGFLSSALVILLGPWFHRRRVARAEGGKHRSNETPWNRSHDHAATNRPAA